MPTYEDERTAFSRSPQVMVGINLDYCGRTFGTSPCLATGTPCYNTWSTCKYPSAWTNAGKDYEFQRNEDFPIGANVRPYLKEYRENPTVIRPERGLAENARLTLTFYDDENDTDIGIDPYVDQRSSVQGSFWRKLLARNEYYLGRTVTVKKGYRGIGKAAFQTSFKGIIDAVKGPTNGQVQIIVKDYLKKADRVDVPKATKGVTTDDPLTAGAGTINLDDGTDYETSGWVRIEDEIIKYTGKTGNQLTGCTRGQFGTTAAQHNKDSVVQQCAVWEDMNPWDIISDNLLNRVGMAAGEIDTAGAEAERDTWLTGITFTGILTKPMKASTLIAEICQQSNSVIWWDQEGQKVRFKVTAPAVPGEAVKSITDRANIKAGSTTLDRNEKSRVTEVVVHYNKTAIGDDNKEESYKGKAIYLDLDKEDVKEYGEPVTKVIFSRWITDATAARVLADRYAGRFKLPPAKYGFGLELKDDDLKAGDLVKVLSRDFLDVDGKQKEKTFQVLSKKAEGHNLVMYEGLDMRSADRYAFIGPNTLPDFPAATDAEKEYGFICENDGKHADGTEGHKIW